MKGTLIALATAGVLASGVSFAGTTIIRVEHVDRSSAIVPVQYYERGDDRSANINEREGRINARIQRGLNDGRITDREARRLYRELANIEAKERAFSADGRLSGREQAELNRDLDRLVDRVRYEARDEQRRY
ncbi:MAG TPA: hypothetical protein VGL25_19415 [Casimicrobiaceae bacterium]|jgi:hypothetical protein